MISIDPTILIVMAEVMLGMLVVIAAAVVYFIKMKKRDKAAVQSLQGRIANNAGQREALFNEMLAQDDASEEQQQANKALAAGLVGKEKDLYGRLIDMYVRRNSTAMQSLDKMLHDYTASYLDMIQLMRQQAGEQTGISQEAMAQLDRMEQEGKKLSGEVDKLKLENERLSKELESAHAEIDQAMREYSSAFRPGATSATKPAAKPEAKAAAPALAAASVATVVQSKAAVAEKPRGLLEDDSLFENEASGLDAAPAAAAAASNAKGLLEDDDLFAAMEADAAALAEAEPEPEPEPPKAKGLLDDDDAFEAAVAELGLIKDDDEQAQDEPHADVVDVAEEMFEEAAEVEAETETDVETSPAAVDENDDEMSLEDVVLHAMAEESAAQKSEPLASAAEPDAGKSHGPVIDLSADDDIDLSELDDALSNAMTSEDELLGDELQTEQQAPAASVTTQAADDDLINEDDLLAQLANIEVEDDALDGFGEFPVEIDADDKKQGKA